MSTAGRWTSYSTLEQQYRDVSSQLRVNAENIKRSERVDADIDVKIVNEMAAGAKRISEELHKKILYSYNMLSEEELSLFTGRQREVLELRQKYKPSKVAEILEMTPESVFDIYNQAINKIQKILKQKEGDIPVGLSPQQERIYELINQGLKYKDIAKILNTSDGNIKKQACLIKKVTKYA